jgi:nicotinamide mononucleotide transporter
MQSSGLLDSIAEAVAKTSMLEWIIFFTSLLYVILAAAANVWCWLFGIIASALSIYLAYQGSLFLESWLQLFYVLIGVYGWIMWKQNSSTKQIRHIRPGEMLTYTMAGGALWLILWYIASSFSSQAMPVLDGFITAFSLIATVLTTKKITENWLLWIIIDICAAWLYYSRGYYLVAVIYVVYTIIAAAGYFKWRKAQIALSGSH